MGPSDIDVPKGGEMPGEMLARIVCEGEWYTSTPRSVVLRLYNGTYIDLDAVASAFKAAVLAGEV